MNTTVRKWEVNIELIVRYRGSCDEPECRYDTFEVYADTEEEAIEKAKKMDKSLLSVWDSYAVLIEETTVEYPSEDPELTHNNTISYPAQLWADAQKILWDSITPEGMLENFKIMQDVLVAAKRDHFGYLNISL